MVKFVCRVGNYHFTSLAQAEMKKRGTKKLFTPFKIKQCKLKKFLFIGEAKIKIKANFKLQAFG